MINDKNSQKIKTLRAQTKGLRSNLYEHVTLSVWALGITITALTVLIIAINFIRYLQRGLG